MNTMSPAGSCATQSLSRWTSGETVASLAQKIVEMKQSQEDESSFYIADLDDLVRKVQRWRKVLPRVKPFYAVKCNHDEAVLRCLADQGLGFDCATRGEISRMLRLQVPSARIVYAHTVKNRSYIRFARDSGVKRMTFDNVVELEKIHEIYPEAELIIRLKVVDSDVFQMCNKFGCEPEDAPELLARAAALGLNVVGVSFHIGVNNAKDFVFLHALALAAKAVAAAEEYGYRMRLIDIGGGFSGWSGSEQDFDKVAAEISDGIEECFGDEADEYEFIAEPGSFFASSAFTLCAKVAGIRMNKGVQQVYVNESIYVSFMLCIWETQHLIIESLKERQSYSCGDSSEGQLLPSVIYGNTCAGCDVLAQSWRLPKLVEGQWLLFRNMGAYSLVAENEFNSLDHPQRFYRTSSKHLLEKLEQHLPLNALNG